MTPGVLYLLGAPLQLSERFRTKHYTLHRRLGRVLVTAAMISVILAIVFGLRFAWGGTPEAMATAVFGSWFLACLLLAVRAIRRDDMINHRRWMIRSFSLIMAGVMLRVWVPIYDVLAAAGILDFSFETAYAGIAWLCWVPNLLLAIWFTRHRIEVAAAA